MPVKRTRKPKDETVPVVFQVPVEMVEDLKKTRKESEQGLYVSLESLRGGFNTLHASFNRHRLETQSELLKYRNLSKEEKIDQITNELEEAFDLVWPKFKELEDSLKKSKNELKDSFSEENQRILESISEHSTLILQLAATVEKRHQSALKKINQTKGLVEVRTDEGETKLIKGEIRRLDLLVKEIGKYEYGSSLQILLAGVPVGFTGQINFKTGFTVVQSGQGIDVSATGTGGGLGFLSATGAVNNANTTFTFASSPTLVVVNGAMYRNGFGVTITGDSAVLDDAPGIGGDVYGLG